MFTPRMELSHEVEPVELFPVLKTLDLRGYNQDYRDVMPRAALDVAAAVLKVQPICQAVKERGVEALREFCIQFDRVDPPHLRVPEAELVKAEAKLDPQLREAFALAIARRRQVAHCEMDAESLKTVSLAPGAQVSQKLIPVSRVGLYVPGGLAPLASSVLMNVIPAQVAGVSSIAVATPPQAEFGGLPHPSILAICNMLGVREVYAVGGAQAIAMFAYGVPEFCPRVDMVTGPGNIFVVAAKRYLRGLIGIDAEAGPTEIAILADDTANPSYVAADLISQAEHDPMAAAVLVTDSPALIAAVDAEVERQTAATKHAQRVQTALSGTQSAFILVDDMAQGLDVVDAYGAEHLEIQTANAVELAAKVRNAGAIFVGSWSPVSLGDYCAGSTHVLPTSGAAAHSSGLNVRSFLKAVHIINYSQQGLQEIASQVEIFAAAEDLPGHGNAITVRRSR